ncbi:hypothetical protein XaFJ1_GM002142 [Xanthomonas albilineans]|nr:hypothetical protein XaFJ1_GM002142 [Xanthomonas albilineans]
MTAQTHDTHQLMPPSQRVQLCGVDHVNQTLHHASNTTARYTWQGDVTQASAA